MDARLEPKVLDRYPKNDHLGYPFNKMIAKFCFTQGIQLHFEH